LLRIEDDLLDAASRLGPPSVMRGFDAIHLASAVQFGLRSVIVVTYDIGTGQAARFSGIATVTPR
jgi:hypothetical protein